MFQIGTVTAIKGSSFDTSSVGKQSSSRSI